MHTIRCRVRVRVRKSYLFDQDGADMSEREGAEETEREQELGYRVRYRFLRNVSSGNRTREFEPGDIRRCCMYGSVEEGGGRGAASGLWLEGRLSSMLTVMLGEDLLGLGLDLQFAFCSLHFAVRVRVRLRIWV